MKLRAILFVELLGGVGDVVIALAAIQALARSHPRAALTVLTFAPGSELLTSDPHVRRILVADASRPRESVRLALAAERFDLVVSDTMYDGIDRLIACGAGRSIVNLWRQPPPDERVGDRFVRLLQQEGVVDAAPVGPGRLHLREPELAEARAATAGLARPLFILLPDSGMAIKRWPEHRFAAAGRALLDRCRGSILVPACGDEAGAARLAARIGVGAHAWQRLPLRQLASLLAAADLVIGVDTGPARIAAALGIRTITLFGPSWAGRYGQPPPHANVQGYAACPERNLANFTRQACWYSGTCPFGSAAACMADIAPETVIATAQGLVR